MILMIENEDSSIANGDFRSAVLYGKMWDAIAIASTGRKIYESSI